MFSYKHGRRDVIDYANEPKLKRTLLDLEETILWKFGWILRYFRFRRPFWIFRFKPFFDRKLGFKGTNDAYIRDQEVKI